MPDNPYCRKSRFLDVRRAFCGRNHFLTGASPGDGSPEALRGERGACIRERLFTGPIAKDRGAFPSHTRSWVVTALRLPDDSNS
jgi:hypothetical protein